MTSRAYWDIETGGLEPERAKVWVASIATDIAEEPVTRKIFVPQGTPIDEAGLISDTMKSLDSFDEIVSWNGWRFDVPFLNHRARRNGLRAMRHDMHIDLGIMTKNRFGLTYWSQERIMAHYGIETNPFPFNEQIWRRAGGYDPIAQEYIVRHCEHDVKSLRRLYHILMLEDPDAFGPAT